MRARISYWPIVRPTNGSEFGAVTAGVGAPLRTTMIRLLRGEGVRAAKKLEMPCSSWLGLRLQHDLPDVLARLHQAVRRGGFLQRKRPIDDRFDDATFEERPDLPSQR